MPTVQGTCTGCGRKFVLATDSTVRTCQICGAKIDLPAGFTAPPKPKDVPTTVNLGCPLCGRSKVLQSVKVGQSVPCWFCQSPLEVGDRDGVARLAFPAEKPRDKTAPLPLPAGDAAADARLPWEVLQRFQAAGALGVRTADWVAQQLQKLSAWEKSGGRARSPFDSKFTAAVVATSVFKAHHALEEPRDGGLLLSISLGENQGGGGPTVGPAMISTAIGLASLVATGSGWVTFSTGESDEADNRSAFLDVDLRDVPNGTELDFSYRTSEGKVGKADRLLGKDFNAKFPSLLSRGSRGILAFKAAFGAAAPARLSSYLTRDSLRAHLERHLGNAAAPADWVDRVFRLIKAE